MLDYLKPSVTYFNNQKSVFDCCFWPNAQRVIKNEKPSAHLNVIKNVRGMPPKATAGVTEKYIPYWEFDWIINSTSGITVSNINARNTQFDGSLEEVFDKIEFADFKVTFQGGTTKNINISKALLNDKSTIAFNIGQSIEQYGIKLTLFDDLDGFGKVRLEISLVFKGANNDFDPGGVPVAMKIWPQLAYTWYQQPPKAKVIKFNGSVKITTKNGKHLSNPGHVCGNWNVASFFTDSNTFLKNYRHKYYGFITLVAADLFNVPRTWGVLFDYAYPNVTEEKEIVAVSTKKFRKKTYYWKPDYYFSFRPLWTSPVTKKVKGIPFLIEKTERQGDYDNIHIHVYMGRDDINKGAIPENVTVHAPFCGHSCIHMHWRWAYSSAFDNKATVKKPERFLGWGKEYPNSIKNAPLIPPNQTLKVALCNPGQTRYNDQNILNASALQDLNTVKKQIWCSYEVSDPPAFKEYDTEENRQVLFEHGIGWAYRYATPLESDAMKELVKKTPFDELPSYEKITSDDMYKFFEKHVYPELRHIEGESVSDGSKKQIQQIPYGTYTDHDNSKPSMESL